MSTLYTHVLDYTTTDSKYTEGGKSKYFFCAVDAEQAGEIARSYGSRLNQRWDGLEKIGVFREITPEEAAELKNNNSEFVPETTDIEWEDDEESNVIKLRK